jgi:hypothetical protein
VKDDGKMDVLKCGNSVPPEDDAAAAGALVEKDGFSVEDLLDLEEFGEPDKDGAEHEDDAPALAAAVEEQPKAESQPLSVVTYELPPPPPPPELVDLPVSLFGRPLPSDRFYSWKDVVVRESSPSGYPEKLINLCFCCCVPAVA